MIVDSLVEELVHCMIVVVDKMVELELGMLGQLVVGMMELV